MATVRWLPHGARVAMPWKNGAGMTWPVAVWPVGAGLDDFGWRISLAGVPGPGAFSRWDGVARSLVLVEGTTLAVVVDGVTHRLAPASAPLVFDGGLPAASVSPGRVLDAGVMSRAPWRHRLDWLAPDAVRIPDGGAGHAVLVNAGPVPVAVTVAGESGVLGYLDAVWLEGAAGPVSVLPQGGRARLLLARMDAGPDA